MHNRANHKIASSHDYRGDKESFAAFKAKYGRRTGQNQKR
jgi:hypothetical protein